MVRHRPHNALHVQAFAGSKASIERGNLTQLHEVGWCATVITGANKFFGGHPKLFGNLLENQLLDWMAALEIAAERPVSLLTHGKHTGVFARAVVFQATAFACWNGTLQHDWINISAPQDVEHLPHLLDRALVGTTDNSEVAIA